MGSQRVGREHAERLNNKAALPEHKIPDQHRPARRAVAKPAAPRAREGGPPGAPLSPAPGPAPLPAPGPAPPPAPHPRPRAGGGRLQVLLVWSQKSSALEVRRRGLGRRSGSVDKSPTTAPGMSPRPERRSQLDPKSRERPPALKASA